MQVKRASDELRAQFHTIYAREMGMRLAARGRDLTDREMCRADLIASNVAQKIIEPLLDTAILEATEIRAGHGND